jgi:NCAIR mutase (PurE)-related protein
MDELTALLLSFDGANTANEELRVLPDGAARVDISRENRKGVPEVIYAERKTDEATLVIARQFLTARTGRAIISRASPLLQERVQSELTSVEWQGQTLPVSVEIYTASGCVVLRREGAVRPNTGGRVGIITAGTSDIPMAEEAEVIVKEMGCQVSNVYDVGVAGLHRLFEPLKLMLASEVDVIIVAAGMDGALPSVVTGLVNVPVIGLPTSVGYGLGGKGVAALLTMLQTCAPGLTVVNIDNGVGAGATAAMIANRVARLRR